jgi:hypothetical protein
LEGGILIRLGLSLHKGGKQARPHGGITEEEEPVDLLLVIFQDIVEELIKSSRQAKEGTRRGCGSTIRETARELPRER